jgi:hypothetical protein
MKKEGHLMRVFHQGRSHVKGYAEDYAFFIQALIDLYEVTFEIAWLKEADHLNREMIRQFWDETEGGFFFTGKENEALIARSKHPTDNVMPSPNSIALFNLIRLGFLTGDDSLKAKAERVLRLFYGLLSEHPSGFAQMLSGLSFFLNPEEIGIIGAKDDAMTQSMVREINLAYIPNRILSLRDPKEPMEGNWFPFLREKGTPETPAAFVCRNFTCLPPAKDEKELRKILQR